MKNRVVILLTLCFFTLLVGCASKPLVVRPYVPGGKDQQKYVVCPGVLAVEVAAISMFPPSVKTNIDTTVLLAELIKERLEVREVLVERIQACSVGTECPQQLTREGLGVKSGKVITLGIAYSPKSNRVLEFVAFWGVLGNGGKVKEAPITLDFQATNDEALYASLKKQLTPWVDKNLDDFFATQPGPISK